MFFSTVKDRNGVMKDSMNFFLLSEAQYFVLDGEKHDMGEFPNYSIMLVEHDTETGVSTRLGLGTVKKTAWMMADPVLKTVIFG